MEFDTWTIKLKKVQSIDEFKHPYDGTRKLNMIYYLKLPKGYNPQIIDERINPNWLIDKINEGLIYLAYD